MTMTQGRLPLPLSDLREGAEENVALAMIEQETSHLALGFVRRTKRLLVQAAQDGGFSRTELAAACSSIGDVEACIVQQLEYDGRDEQVGRGINVQIGALIKERRPLARAASQSKTLQDER